MGQEGVISCSANTKVLELNCHILAEDASKPCQRLRTATKYPERLFTASSHSVLEYIKAASICEIVSTENKIYTQIHYQLLRRTPGKIPS